jgi:hypothetical protein
MPYQPTEWKGAWTLDDYIVNLIASKQTQSAEFQTMLRIFGREKLEKIWKEHREKVRRPIDPDEKKERIEKLLDCQIS